MTDDTGGLSAAAWASLEQAWQALLRGNLPIGAVLLNGSGQVVATGQNMVYVASPAGGPPSVSRSLLAHAEVNALVTLAPERRYQDFHLVTSLEPCPLCMGAIRMATIGQLTYLGADPFNGAATADLTTPYTGRVPLQVSGPDEGAAGRLGAGLHLAFFLRFRPGSRCAAAHERGRPDLVAAARALIGARAFELAGKRWPWRDVASQLLSAV